VFFIGLYPIIYFVATPGFLFSKGNLINELPWQIAFNAHIIGGGIALIIGFIQFKKSFRERHYSIHRLIGKIYVFSVLLFGATGGFYIALFANGGFANSLGFGSLAVLWFYFTLKAFIFIKNRDFDAHKDWMVRSYALTFAAVTLRIWNPLFQFGFGISGEEAYAAIAWFCWVPNLVLAEILLHKKWITV